MRNIAGILCILTAAVLAVCITTERQACARLVQDNETLRRRLIQLEKQRAEPTRTSSLDAENGDSKTSPNRVPPPPSASDELARELTRLRTEVEALQKQSKVIEALRADTHEARAATDTASKSRSASRPANMSPGGSANASQFEVLSADYWTEKTNMDVAAELRDRIRGDSLKAVANNNLKGDPEFGTTKRLTIVYRFGGATFTNEFREGEYIALPKEPAQQ
jgi:hypothetical protein